MWLGEESNNNTQVVYYCIVSLKPRRKFLSEFMKMDPFCYCSVINTHYTEKCDITNYFCNAVDARNALFYSYYNDYLND